MEFQPVVDLCQSVPEGGSCVLLMVREATKPMVAVHAHFAPGEPIEATWLATQFARRA